MIFKTPDVHSDEERVLEQIREMWKLLQFQLQNQPHRWRGFLARAAFARGIRGSNSIEGYVVSDDDAMAAVDGDEPFDAKQETWRAITGYREAMTYALRVGGDPHARMDATLIRSLHFMMLSYDLPRNPGSWRPGPIWVSDSDGKHVYEAPDVALVPSLMDELVAEINANQSASSMIRAAMAHLNLIMIHPFSDGNGRMGRCLQTLILARAGVYDPVSPALKSGSEPTRRTTTVLVPTWGRDTGVLAETRGHGSGSCSRRTISRPEHSCEESGKRERSGGRSRLVWRRKNCLIAPLRRWSRPLSVIGSGTSSTGIMPMSRAIKRAETWRSWSVLGGWSAEAKNADAGTNGPTLCVQCATAIANPSRWSIRLR